MASQEEKPKQNPLVTVVWKQEVVENGQDSKENISKRRQKA